jgi:hypothetical protein
MANQMAEEDTVQVADVVIDGSADLPVTAGQVADALDRLQLGT